MLSATAQRYILFNVAFEWEEFLVGEVKIPSPILGL